ncbi:hypothetical protein I3842_15G077500 [Carya illinoinensis]|uniref:Uncharacterized protein n=1 Tax=Carya illinoinensis TaxID=32201 RepID=A0A922D1Y9_CARIL|nr:hypothetical protein I3842_15G077500 [Carya illinoinensis]
MERAFVLICIFWAVLTIITPTLILLSENSKLLDSNVEKNGVKAKPRRMMGFADQKRPSKAPIRLTLMEAPVPVPARARAPAPAPAPAPAVRQATNPALRAKRSVSYLDYFFSGAIIVPLETDTDFM